MQCGAVRCGSGWRRGWHWGGEEDARSLISLETWVTWTNDDVGGW